MFELKLQQRKRHILHIDADAFFASVEQVLNPTLKGKAVLVGGPSEKKGIVSAASYEARKFGIKAGMAMYLAKKQCPHAIVVNGNFEAYRSFSKRMYEIFCKFTPDVEMVSIDEAYLDITGIKGDPAEIAKSILVEIYKKLGLSASCGLSTTKTVAKVASSMNKPHKLTVVPAGSEKGFLAPLSLRSLPGVGPKTFEVLDRYGFKKIGDIAKLHFSEVIEIFGIKGITLWKKCKGMDDGEVNPDKSLPKSISKEHTFYEAVNSEKMCIEALKELSVQVFSKLRLYEMKASTIFIKVRYKNSFGQKQGYRDISIQKNLGILASSDKELFPLICDLFLANHQKGEVVRLIGMGVSGLVQNYNLSLFEDSSRADRLFMAVDSIKSVHGKATLNYGA
ncbi:DNA polymerase IV [Candidatus Peregrinibacteria bacterium CG10_big_fil_rev_8_21_14_0_10_36_19]|nr:MAG: DNA polymerase IV [Candidatus Peregrinibacteria bacterium CG10_big_fil_rev_8_21_14_0_10_36_19]